MKDLKRKILTYSFIAVLAVTLALAAWIFISLAIDRVTSDNGFEIAIIIIVSIVLAFLLGLITVCEVSFYFNLRYFLLSEKKTPLKTAFNSAMVASMCLGLISVLLLAFGPSSESFEKVFESFSFVFFGILLALRIAYPFVCLKNRNK